MIRFGPFEVRPATRELFKHGIRVKLPPQAFEVLRILLERRGELVTRQEFHRALWQADTFVDFEQGLNNAVKRIREVLNDSPESPCYVETLPRLGYRFIGKIDQAEPELPPPAATGNGLPAAPPNETVEPAQGSTLESPAARRRGAWMIAAGAAVAGLLILAWLFRPHYPKPRITASLQLTADGAPKFGPLATDGLRLYFTEDLDGRETVNAVPVGGGQAFPLKLPFSSARLYDISPGKADLLVAESKDMMSEAPLWRVPTIGGPARRLGSVKAHDATWSPDGAKLAYTTGGGLYLANADGSEPRTLVAPGANLDVWAWRPAWSPDSRRIRFDLYNMETHDAHLWEVNTDGSNLHPVFKASKDWPMQATGGWTRDGRYYVFSAWQDIESAIPVPAMNLWAWREKADLFHRAWTMPEELTLGPTHYSIHTMSQDGKTIFVIGIHKHGELMRYDARAKDFSLYASGLSAEGVSFSRDGAWVAYVTFPQGELWRSRVDGSEPLQLSFRPLFASTPVWSPDGKQIAFNGTRAGEETQPYLVSTAGGEPRRIDKAADGVDPNWSPDGSSLAFMDGDHENGMIRVLNLRTGSVVAIPGSKTLLAPRISPDGRWIAALSLQVDKLLLFDMQKQTWRELAKADRIEWPHWSHDGRYIYFERADFKAADSGFEVARVGVKGGLPEVMLQLKSYRTTGVDPAWFTLTPQDDIVVLHDTGGGTEIYALAWDAP